MSRRRWSASLVWCLAAGVQGATTVPVQWTIQTQGSGPGFATQAATTSHEIKVNGPCSICESLSPGFPTCVHTEGKFSAVVSNLAAVPVGDTNIAVSFSGGASYRGKGTWGFGTTFPGCAPSICPNLYGGGFTGTGSAASGHFTARVPHTGGFEIGVDMDVIRGSESIFACGCPGCNVPGGGCCACDKGGFCGKGADQWTMTVVYKTTTITQVPKSCQQSGTTTAEPDGIWHQVASATCMTAPNTATAWSCASSSASGLVTECVMVPPGVVPSGTATGLANGPVLWVRAGCRSSPLHAVNVLKGTVAADAGVSATPFTSATVTADSGPNHFVRVTGADGAFDFGTVPVGEYLITATAQGYDSATALVTVTLDPVCPLPLEMKLHPPICSTCSMMVDRIGQGDSPWGQHHLDCVRQYPQSQLPAICPTFTETKTLVWGNILKLNILNPLACLTATFANEGCLLTSLAMVLGITPDEVNIQGTCSGGIDPTSGSLASWQKLSIALGFSVEFVSTDVTDEAALAGLCAQKYVIVRVTKPKGDKIRQHFVVVTKLEPNSSGVGPRCRLKLADPGSRNFQYLDEYDSAGWTRARIMHLKR